MVVLALPFAYLHFRSGGITSYVFGGVLIGISFFLLNNVFGYIGNLQNWRPWLTAAAPGLIYSHVFAGRVRLAGAAAVGRCSERKAIILFGHGSRDPLLAPPDRGGGRPAGSAAACVAGALRLPGAGPARPACAAAPTGRAGRNRVTVVPMFLGTGKHAREDLPRWSQALRRAHPQVRLQLAAARGRRSAVLDLLAKIALE